MEPMALVLGVSFVSLGYYAYRYPERTRSFVSARTWAQRPNYAERLHERRARRSAIFFVLFGLTFVVLGLLL